MKWSARIAATAALIVLLSGHAFPGLYAAGEAKSRWIVVYRNATSKDSAVARRGGGVRRSFRIIPAFAADLTATEVQELRNDPSVASVEPDAVRHLSNPTLAIASLLGPLAVTPWQVVPYGIDMVHARDVWAYTKGSGVKVADLDTGIDLTHPDVPSITLSATFTNAPVQDTNGHGTHTSGTIGAPDNGTGVVGVAPLAQLLVGQVFSRSGTASDSDIIEGIQWAVSNGAKVINMSFGGSVYDGALDLACSNAAAAGVVLVAAAGNENSGNPSYPASYSSVISVAAVDQFKQRASFSNYGSAISVCAPGVGVLSSVLTGSGAYSAAYWGGRDRITASMDKSAAGTVTAAAVYCGIGNPGDFPAGIAGKIAHIRRGTLTFEDKVNNAKAAGAVGVVISNDSAGVISGTLNKASTLVAVTVSQADGNDLQANNGTTVTITSQASADYASWDGTSMSTPHVTGVVALLAAARHGSITPSEVRSILQSTAEDLGTAGRDNYYGYGLVNVAAALQMTVPLIQSVSANPTFAEPGESISVSLQPTTTSGVSSVTANGSTLTRSGGTWSGVFPASILMGTHPIDVLLTDAWGNTRTSSVSYKTAPVVAATTRSLMDQIATTALNNFTFLVCGKASQVTANSFVLSDGSPYTVTVNATGHGVSDGKFVRARGLLQKISGSAVIQTTAAKVAVLD